METNTKMEPKTLYMLGYNIKQISDMTGIEAGSLYTILEDVIEKRESWTRGPKPTRLLGKKYGLLTITDYVSRIRSREYMVNCMCDCGEEVILPSKDITIGKITSCGCQKQPPSGPIMIGGKTLYQYAREQGIHYNVLLKRLLDGRDATGEERGES